MAKKLLLLFLVGVIVGILSSFAFPFIFQTFQSMPSSASVQAIISPGAEQKILQLVYGSQENLEIMLYQFSHSPLKKALVDAASRGVRVRLILEPKLDQNIETGAFLIARGVEVRWASRGFNNYHPKTAVFDSKCVLVGSPNWSRSAMFYNREIALFSCDPAATQEIKNVFEQDWAEATPAVPA